MIKHIKTYSQFLNESQTDPNVVNPHFYKTENEIHSFMEKIGFRRYTGYTVNDDLHVSTNSSVGIAIPDLKYIPVRFEHTGDFFVSVGTIKTLEGCPYSMVSTDPESNSAWFYCNDSDLRTLLYAPKKPTSYEGNPCSHIYDKFGWTDEAHA